MIVMSDCGMWIAEWSRVGTQSAIRHPKSALRLIPADVMRIPLFCFAVFGSLLLGLSLPAYGQSQPKQIPVLEQSRYLIESYRSALLRETAERVLGPLGTRMEVQPMAPMPLSSAELAAALADLWPEEPAPEPEKPRFEVQSWEFVKKLGRAWFEQEYDETLWAYVGSNYWTPVDTMYTWRWRAILEETFGPPTKTLAELDFSREIRLEEYIQFEYWFVLNDSIPLRIMDVNGPFERGLVVSTDQRYRHILFDIRQAFLLDLAISPALKPYADYYYHTELNTWYRTGFDGEAFFLEPISRPNLERGRPWMSSGGR